MAINKDWVNDLKWGSRLDGTTEQARKDNETFLNSIPEELKIESMSDKYAYLDEGLGDE